MTELNEAFLRQRYVIDGRSMQQIGNEVGCSASWVYHQLRRHGIPTRSNNPVVAIDQRFGRLTVIEQVESSPAGKRRYLCRCDCGGQTIAVGTVLKQGRARSCGCLVRERIATQAAKGGRASAAVNRRHGHSPMSGPTPTYLSWSGMVQRCTNPQNPNWPDYGGRGIAVHPAWLGASGFETFLAHIGERKKGDTLDRIDNSGNYKPGNVRWASRKVQANNRRPRRRTTASDSHAGEDPQP